MIKTKRRVLAQVVLCKGCCCGRTDKGRPPLPEERLKAAWKERRLNRTIQLTVSGCLGPCDVANVVQIITPRGTEWFGGFDQDAHYDALLDWATACSAARDLLPRPGLLAPHLFSGYISDNSQTIACAKIDEATST
ncbi:MAG TPA: (2Fe-2S) ferredoxin domain-containing protein [Blastocatellia bacterium]|nr:(2Fe-2S) ferredoxin domain-containing protein [Blastocatellia bacterium]